MAFHEIMHIDHYTARYETELRNLLAPRKPYGHTLGTLFGRIGL